MGAKKSKRPSDGPIMNKNRHLLAISLALMVVGGFIAFLTQTNGGTVRIKDVQFVGPGGIVQNARLYVPKGATSEHPAPGIVAIHGYINTHETQAGFAIEFARRGYVVLAVDQTGHGFSDPPTGANGSGGPPALAFLRTLDIVDPANIGMEGHSMGGWAILAAAAANPDGYRSLVLEGSSVGRARASSDTSTPLRNVAVVFSRFDEFSGSMWGAPVPKDIVSTDRLKALFGAEEDVVPGRIYGSIQDGSARVLYQPPVTHPGDHLSRVAIGNAVEWFQSTLEGGNDLPSTSQIWYWREFGTLMALVGMVLLLFPVGDLLLRTPLLLHVIMNCVRAVIKLFGAAVSGIYLVESLVGIVDFSQYRSAGNLLAKKIPGHVVWNHQNFPVECCVKQLRQGGDTRNRGVGSSRTVAVPNLETGVSIYNMPVTVIVARPFDGAEGDKLTGFVKLIGQPRVVIPVQAGRTMLRQGQKVQTGNVPGIVVGELRGL